MVNESFMAFKNVTFFIYFFYNCVFDKKFSTHVSEVKVEWIQTDQQRIHIL